MDYYQILGIAETASQDEIKQAYRKLAAQHHPDKGGDTATFQSISQAYDTLGDQQKRAQYDAQRNPSQFGGGTFHFTSGNFDDVFSHIFGGNSPFGAGGPFGNAFGQQRQARKKNKDLTIRVKISLRQSYTGAELEASYRIPSGKQETVSIKIPEGVQSGQTIRYPGLGDDSDTSLPRGDLNVTVLVDAEQNYERRGDDVITYITISPIEAMIGCIKTVENLDGEQYTVNVRPGCQHGEMSLISGKGFKNLRGNKGNLIGIIIFNTPAIKDPILKEKLEKINAEINSIK